MAVYVIDSKMGKWVAAPACAGIAEDLSCSPTALGGKNMNTHDLKPTAFFMDVGCWQGGEDGKPKTTFGVVCGYDALLCDWLGYKYPINPNTSYQAPQSLPNVAPKLQQFLDTCKSFISQNPGVPKRWSHRGGVMAWARSEFRPFTEADKMLVVVPDTHIHLFKGHPVDRFVYRPDPATRTISHYGGKVVITEVAYNSKITSLDSEMADFLSVAKDLGAKVVQVGDWYEVWESEMLLRWTYKCLLDYALEWCIQAVIQDTSMDQSAWDEPFIGGSGALVQAARSKFQTDFPDGAIKRMILSGRVLVPDPPPEKSDRSFESFSGYIKDSCIPVWRSLQWTSSIQKTAVDFTSTQAICEAIQKLYPGSFPKQTFTALLHGNHDNFLQNTYWTNQYIREWSSHPFDVSDKLSQPTKAWDRSTRSYNYPSENHYRFPENSSTPTVWIEHGHYYDWHNNDDDWSKVDNSFAGRGFDIIFRGPKGMVTKGIGFDYINLKTKWSRAGTEGVLELADWYAYQEAYEMRLPEFRLADVILHAPYQQRDYVADHIADYSNYPPPRLIIMGHTHGPVLMEFLVDAPLRKLTRDVRDKFERDYVWKSGYFVQRSLDRKPGEKGNGPYPDVDSRLEGDGVVQVSVWRDADGSLLR